MKTQIAKNVLLVYQGGGYSGCFWEWNCFLFDWQGNFHNLHSTGYAGIKDETEARERVLAAMHGEGKREDYLVHVMSLAQVKHFNKEYAASLVVGAMHSVMQIYNHAPANVQRRLKARIVCDVCECDVFDKEEIHYADYRGEGGIVIAPHAKICQQCYDNGSCEMCREIGDDPYCGEKNLNKDGLCEFHAPFKVLELLGERRVLYCEETEEIYECWDAKKLGERQLAIMFERAGNQYTPMYRALAKAHTEGCNRLDGEIVELWKELEDQWDALTLEEDKVATPPLATATG
jgi:hypothetical protein